MRFYQLEPFGLLREDMRSAIVASTVAAPNMPKGKKARVADFMPKFRRPKSEQRDKEKLAVAQQIIGWLKNANNRQP